MSKEKEKERRRDADIRRQIKKEYEDKLQESASRIIVLEAAIKQQEVECRELKRQHHILQRKAEETEATSSAIGLIISNPLIKMAADVMQQSEIEAATARDAEVQPEMDVQETGTTKLKLDFVNDLIFLKKRDFLEIYRVMLGEAGYNVLYSIVNVNDADLTPVIETIAAKVDSAALLLNKKPIVSYDEAQKLMYREAEIPENDVVFR